MSIRLLIENIGHKYPVTDGFVLGANLYFGGKSKEFLSEAFGSFHKAALKGDSAAQYLVSRLLIHGQGAEKNTKSGLEFLEAAADGHIHEAQYDLAICHFLGAQNFEKAQSRLNDHWERYPHLYVLLPDKITSEPDLETPGYPSQLIPLEVKNLGQQIHQSVFDHALNQPNAVYGENPPPKILSMNLKLAPLREYNSFRIPNFELSHLLYLEAFETDSDRKAAKNWLKRAAQGGLAPAKTLLGSYLIVSQENPSEGFSLLQLAAEAGDPEALVVYGNYLCRGALVTKDVIKAISYYSRAAEKGDPEGILGQILSESLVYGSPKNKEKAAKELAVLAAQGLELPQLLGQYALGPVNPEKPGITFH
ncbi:MAG: hypothetical protein LBE80_02335 [Deltaproteobacteria bacterium]|nr:hypothetical protein [Deltaproteobacteria bacterium]